MTSRITFAGFDDSEYQDVVPTVRQALANEGVDYKVMGIQWNNADVVTAVDLDGSTTTGATRAIDLPPMRQVLNKWKSCLISISGLVPYTTVSVVINGEVQVALNGTILS